MWPGKGEDPAAYSQYFTIILEKCIHELFEIIFLYAFVFS
jgi:hypothetical protein